MSFEVLTILYRDNADQPTITCRCLVELTDMLSNTDLFLEQQWDTVYATAHFVHFNRPIKRDHKHYKLIMKFK